jgi:hypothetical protein
MTIFDFSKLALLIAVVLIICFLPELIAAWRRVNILNVGQLGAGNSDLFSILISYPTRLRQALTLKPTTEPMLQTVEGSSEDLTNWLNSPERIKLVQQSKEYENARQYQKAIDEYTVGIDKCNLDGELYYLRAVCYEFLGQEELADLDRSAAARLGYRTEKQ